MNEATQVAVYRGLSDSLSAAIDTGNLEEVVCVLCSASFSFQRKHITREQYADLKADAKVAGYDL